MREHRIKKVFESESVEQGRKREKERAINMIKESEAFVVLAVKGNQAEGAIAVDNQTVHIVGKLMVEMTGEVVKIIQERGGDG